MKPAHQSRNKVLFSLVGVNHAHQLVGYEQGAATAFKQFLNDLCLEQSFELVAEELNAEEISIWPRATGSAVREVAATVGVGHLYCDPTRNERRVLGIPDDSQLRAELGYGRCLSDAQVVFMDTETAKFWEVRERFWLERIETTLASSCLFVLGSKHVDNFHELVVQGGHSAIVLTHQWEPNPATEMTCPGKPGRTSHVKR